MNGGGHINTLVNNYLDQSPSNRWFNAAGNYHKRFFQSELKISSENPSYIELPHFYQYTKFIVHESGQAKFVASWDNDEQGIENLHQLDLRLELYDSNTTLLAASQKQFNTPNEFHFAKLSALLEPGEYWIALKTGSSDLPENLRFHITANHHSGEFQNFTPYESSVVMPADNPRVITIGAQDYEYSSFGKSKPDYVNISKTVLRDGYEIKSSSTANAIGAAGWILYENSAQSQNQGAALNKEQIMNKISKDQNNSRFSLFKVPSL